MLEGRIIKITPKLPENPRDTSIMTLKELCEALGGSKEAFGFYDPGARRDKNKSRYYVYAINNEAGLDDSAECTAEALIDVVTSNGYNWYGLLNRTISFGSVKQADLFHYAVGGHNLFGGPLYYVYFDHNNDGYRFFWLYRKYKPDEPTTPIRYSGGAGYWGDYVSGDVCVAVVRSENK